MSHKWTYAHNQSRVDEGAEVNFSVWNPRYKFLSNFHHLDHNKQQAGWKDSQMMYNSEMRRFHDAILIDELHCIIKIVNSH